MWCDVELHCIYEFFPSFWSFFFFLLDSIKVFEWFKEYLKSQTLVYNINSKYFPSQMHETFVDAMFTHDEEDSQNRARCLLEKSLFPLLCLHRTLWFISEWIHKSMIHLICREVKWETKTEEEEEEFVPAEVQKGKERGVGWTTAFFWLSVLDSNLLTALTPEKSGFSATGFGITLRRPLSGSFTHSLSGQNFFTKTCKGIFRTSSESIERAVRRLVR